MLKTENALAITDASLSQVSKRIYTLRGCQVMLDTDLAKIYQVETKSLKRAVKRNIERFPLDFLFELSQDEIELLRCQIGTENSEGAMTHGGQMSCDASKENTSLGAQEKILRCQSGTEDSLVLRSGRYTPFVFTELGIAMLSSVLQSDRAIQINIAIMRLFTQLRARMLMNQIDLSPKLDSLKTDLAQVNQKLDHLSVKSGRVTESPVSQQSDKIKAIQEAVARHCGLSVDNLKSPQRTKSIASARQLAIYLMRKHLGMSFSELGNQFGQRDHTTILHAYRKIQFEAEDSARVRNAILVLQDQLAPILA